MSPKAFLPLGSVSARKQFGKNLTFAGWKGSQRIRSYSVPTGDASEAQLTQRAIIKSKVEAWQALTPEEKAGWEALAKDKGNPWYGYTLFISTEIGEDNMSHNLLSATHPDSIAASPVAGDLLFANDTPKWTKLSKGYEGKILKMISNEPAWDNLVRVERHLSIDPKRFQMPAANYPAEGFEGIFYTLDFDKDTEESAFTQSHVPFRWDPTTDILFSVEWLHDGVDAGKVAWGLEYKSINEGKVVAGTGATITQLSAGSHTAGVDIITTFSFKILHADLDHNDDLSFRVFRKTVGGGDTLAEDARLISVHLHYTANALGQVMASSENYGLTWEDLGQQFSEGAVFALAYLGGGIALAGTGSNGKILRSVDYGATWADLGQQFGEDYIHSLVYLGNGVALAGTEDGGKILRSTDWGATWADLGRQGGQWYILALESLGNGIALAGGLATGKIFRSVNYGATWADLGQQYSQQAIKSLAYLGNGIALAGTQVNGKILRSVDYGLTWADLGQQFSESYILSLINLGNGVALAGTGPNGKILRSTDYGLTWTDLGQQYSGLYLRSLAYLGNGVALAGTGQNGKILRSVDYGETWADLGQQASQIVIYSLADLKNGIALAGTQTGGKILRSPAPA